MWLFYLGSDFCLWPLLLTFSCFFSVDEGGGRVLKRGRGRGRGSAEK